VRTSYSTGPKPDWPAPPSRHARRQPAARESNTSPLPTAVRRPVVCLSPRQKNKKPHHLARPWRCRSRQSGFPETNPLRIRDFLPLSCGRFGFLLWRNIITKKLLIATRIRYTSRS